MGSIYLKAGHHSLAKHQNPPANHNALSLADTQPSKQPRHTPIPQHHLALTRSKDGYPPVACPRLPHTIGSLPCLLHRTEHLNHTPQPASDLPPLEPSRAHTSPEPPYLVCVSHSTHHTTCPRPSQQSKSPSTPRSKRACTSSSTTACTSSTPSAARRSSSAWVARTRVSNFGRCVSISHASLVVLRGVCVAGVSWVRADERAVSQ